MTPLERRCRWLLRAYPTWYRRGRSEEMLGTLLEASPPGRRWPTFREAGALIAGGTRVRGWVWWLSMVWVVIGGGGAIYATVVLTHPAYQEVMLLPPTVQWPGEPHVVIDAAPIAEVAWGLLSVPVLVAGFGRLRGWRLRNWLRLAAWAGSWVAGLVLMSNAAAWVAAGEYGTRGALRGLRAREMAICAAWLLLGTLMTWLLAAPPAGRWDVLAGAAKPAAHVGEWPTVFTNTRPDDSGCE